MEWRAVGLTRNRWSDAFPFPEYLLKGCSRLVHMTRRFLFPRGRSEDDPSHPLVSEGLSPFHPQYSNSRGSPYGMKGWGRLIVWKGEKG